MIEFQNPEILLLLLLLPFIVIVHMMSLYFFSKRAFKFANFETLKRLSDERAVFSKRIPQLILRLFLVTVIVVAIAGPIYLAETDGTGERIVFAIDSSGSMMADDISPTRLDAAKSALNRFIGTANVSMECAIISFSSVSNLEQGMTDDKQKLAAAIDGIQIKRSRGTSIGEALNYASLLLSEPSDKDKLIILLTDGQENVLNSEELADSVKGITSQSIRVQVIGLGTDEGGALFEDGQGRSILNEDALRLISESDADYYIALDEDEIVTGLSRLTTPKKVMVPVDISFWLYIVFFAVLMIEWYLANYLFRTFP